MTPNRLLALLLLSAFVAGCATRSPAPVVERAKPEPPKVPVVSEPVKPLSATDAQTKVHVVQKGETLIAVALQHGVDYRELAAWNNIENVNLIQIGQELKVTAPTSATPTTAGGVTTTPLATPGVPVARPLDAQPPGTPTATDTKPGGPKTEPKAVKLPYSDKALADLEAEAKASSSVGAAQVAATPVTAPATPVAPAASKEDDKIDWAWPAKGKLLSAYSEAGKGIDIAGVLNTPVLAAADGKVMYSGTGIRGYGKLVILKHNNLFLSAYAHNHNIVVKEGQEVKKGQKIAEMGSTDTDQVKLHFEIRRQGKPVDPGKVLPAQ